MSQKQGREKLHYLNPAPIRRVHDRWVSKYAEPCWPQRPQAESGEHHREGFQIHIRTAPERLWEAITDDQLCEGASAEIYGGWPMILSGLKTWLETGEVLTTPGSLMYS